MGLHNEPAREANIAAIVDYFESGIKPAATAPTLGIELEHTLLYTDGRPVSYSDDFGQRWLLEQLRAYYPTPIVDESGALVGLFGEGETAGSSVTLEPAAQLELSAGPYRDLADAAATFTGFQNRVRELVEPHGIELLTPGYHPTRRAIDLTLIPKRRYDIMNEYLGAISMYGICMMRGSGSAQVAIDFYSAADALRKVRLANACVPVFALMCDNSPVFEAAPAPHRLMRTSCWEFCDPDRCNTVPGAMDAGFDFADYAQYILNTPAMVDASGPTSELSGRPWGEIYADRVMTRADIEHVVATFFNDVRLKTYVEIRPADAMPLEYVIAYAALIKGLFYGEGGLDAMDRLFAGVDAVQIADAKRSLMREGYDGRVYGHPVSAVADELVSIAATGLSRDDRLRLAPLANLVERRVTLADLAAAGAGAGAGAGE